MTIQSTQPAGCTFCGWPLFSRVGWTVRELAEPIIWSLTDSTDPISTMPAVTYLLCTDCDRHVRERRPGDLLDHIEAHNPQAFAAVLPDPTPGAAREEMVALYLRLIDSLGPATPLGHYQGDI